MDKSPAAGRKYKELVNDTSAVMKNTWESDKPYDCKPGVCVIINNMVFDKLSELPGGEQDEKSLQVLFTTLGFVVKVHQNLKANQMISQVESYSREEHKGAFFLIILSHGGKGDVVFGTDGGTVEVHYLQTLFYSTKCPSLSGVPKVLVIDACRGSEEEKVLDQHKPKKIFFRKSTALEKTKTEGSVTSSTDSADFAVIFASTRGNVAYSSTREGSHLTQKFVEVITEADSDKKFAEIMQEVSARVQKFKAQTVEVHSTFTKPYLIKRDTGMATIQELNKRFHDAVVPFRDLTIQQVQQTAVRLQEHHRNVNISRVTGASTSIAGSIIAVVGFGLAPVTLGASFGLSAIGLAVARGWM